MADLINREELLDKIKGYVAYHNPNANQYAGIVAVKSIIEDMEQSNE